MATSTEKYQLVLEAREAAAAKIKKLNKQIKDLGGPAMVKSQKEVGKLERQVKLLSKSAEKGKPVISRFVKGIALGNVIAMATAKALAVLKKGVDEVAKATKVAARIEVLNHVMEMTGQNAGYTVGQLRGYKQAIMALGIAENEALAIEQRFIQAKLDVSDATKIATAAQNLAVIADTNSSEAALGLTDAIVQLNPILLKQYGIITDLDKIYNQQAKTLGKTRDELNETEKRQAFLNEILLQADTVAGAYETAMRDVGKQITSLPRYYQEAQKAIGTYFLPVMRAAVGATKDSLKALTELFQSTEDATAKFYASVGAFDASAKSTEELIAQYEDLIVETDLSTIKQGELEGIMRRLLAIMPDAADGWDSVNKVISINTDRIRDNWDAKRALFRLEEADKIQEWKNAYEDLNEEAATGAKNMGTFATIIQSAFAATTRGMEAATHTYDNYTEVVASAKAEQHDLIIALSQGFDTTTEYGRAVTILGEDLANLIRDFQNSEIAAQNLNAQLKDILAGPTELPKFDIQKSVDIEGKFIVQNIGIEDETVETFTENLRMMMSSRITEPMLKAEDILPIDDIDAATKQINESVKNAITADIVSRKQGEFTAAFASIGRSGVDSLARTIASGRGKISDVFKGIYEDFMTFFIKQALASIVNMFIPGLGSILGGIFDTPKYDRLAMEQGEHFAHYFAQGVFQNMRSGSEFMRGIVPSAGNLAMPAMAGAAPAASGASTINNYFSGNVLSSEFVEQQVAPMLSKLVTNGKSDLALTPENVTGGRNIRVY